MRYLYTKLGAQPGRSGRVRPRSGPARALCALACARLMITVSSWAMPPAGSSEPVARPGASGVVSRPTLWQRLGAAPRVTVVSAPPGSGKTVLLRPWLREAGLAERAAWVPVGRDERDPQRLWLSVLGALRQTIPGSALVRALTAAPD